MSVRELIDAIIAKGGVLTLNGEQLKFRLPKDAVYMLSRLREQKSGVTEILKARGGRAATFPHCPRCSSYALYRRNNIGNYECETCGLPNIPEEVARRTVKGKFIDLTNSAEAADG